MSAEIINLDDYRKERGYWFREAAEAEIRREELLAELEATIARRAFCLTQLGFYPDVEDPA